MTEDKSPPRDRLISGQITLMAKCYEGVKGFLGREPKDCEIRMINTLFTETNRKINAEAIRELTRKIRGR